MSNTNRHNTTYSAADIEKYLKGELSAREMHDLENAALEDPFLADALDGMSIILSSAPAAARENPGNADDTGLSRDLDELHTRLNSKVAADKGKIRLVPWWSVAAGIILLLGIGYGIYYTSFTGIRPPAIASSPRQAEANAPAKDTSTPQAEADAKAKEASPAAATTSVEPPSLAKATTPAPPAKSNKKEDREEDKARPANADAETKLEKKTETKQDTITGTYATADIAPKQLVSHQLARRLGGLRLDSTRNAMVNAFYSRQSNSLVFNGTVLDNHNNPVQGASLILKGYRKTSTVTDGQGQFSLHLRPQDSTQYLTVAMVGYEQKSLPLNTLITEDVAGHIIHLQSNETSLNEVEVTGFGSKRKETIAAAPSNNEEELDSLWLKARPVVGRNAYLQYLDTAQKALAFDSSISGTEMVSFEVDRKGILTAFKIERSLSPAYDEAIIRLIKEGPAWQLLRQKKVRALVSLHF